MNGKYALHATKFQQLDGEDLAGLTKEDFLRRCPEIGDAIYNRVRSLLTTTSTTTPTKSSVPGTHVLHYCIGLIKTTNYLQNSSFTTRYFMKFIFTRLIDFFDSILIC